MKAARVLFLIPLPEPFDYEIPAEMHIEAGDYVMAPVGQTVRLGVVWDVIEADSERELKSIASKFDAPPLNANMRRFVDWASAYVCAPPGTVLRMVVRSLEALKPSPVDTVYRKSGKIPERMTDARTRVLDALPEGLTESASELAKAAAVSPGVVKGLADAGALEIIKRSVDAPYPPPDPSRNGPSLTDEQVIAAGKLIRHVQSNTYAPVLLDGVTGSGKTEVYFEAIAETLKQDPDAQFLVLLPEIALTQAILSRFEQRFGAQPVEWHSSISSAERRRAWREVANGRAQIVVGARSALFLPFSNLKMIVVDEEHDASYKQEDGIIYHARDLAVMRAKLDSGVVILASATPSLETLTNAQAGRYDHIQLLSRIGKAVLPSIGLIDMKQSPPPKEEWLSPKLITALEETYSAGEQSLLFLNRRGYAPLVICFACGERMKTPGTESWLVEHRYTGRLVCHLTGYSVPKPTHCPHCGAKDSLRGVGPGVERLAENVRHYFPNARIDVFSSDTAASPEDVKKMIESMAAGEIDILIGTQIVAKGHNFPGLTLVGVVDADSGLRGGDLRAGERTYQLLSQVAGRAGRADKPGRALLQTYQPDNPAMVALAHSDRDGFLDAERTNRDLMSLPPFGRLAAVIMSAASEVDAKSFAEDVASKAPATDGVDVWGPAPAPITVLRGRWRFRLLIRADKGIDLSAYMAEWRRRIKTRGSSRIAIDIDPYSFL